MFTVAPNSCFSNSLIFVYEAKRLNCSLRLRGQNTINTMSSIHKCFELGKETVRSMQNAIEFIVDLPFDLSTDLHINLRTLVSYYACIYLPNYLSIYPLMSVCLSFDSCLSIYIDYKNLSGNQKPL